MLAAGSLREVIGELGERYNKATGTIIIAGFVAPDSPLQQRVRRNRWLHNACAAGTMLHGAPTVHLWIKHFQGPAAGVGWQRACDVII